MGFDRISYLGSIEDDVSTLDPITLSEGYTTDVIFSLQGGKCNPIIFVTHAVLPAALTMQTMVR